MHAFVRWVVAFALVGCSARPAAEPHAPPPSVASAAPDAGAEPAPLDTSQWAHGSDSTMGAPAAKQLSQYGSCLVDSGCPRAATIPACPASVVETASSSAFAEPIESNGRRVVLRGRLSAKAPITVVACGTGCCNAAQGAIALESGGRELALTDAAHPNAFGVRGDESIACSGFELPAGDVLVAGRLTESNGTFGLDDVAVCDLGPESPPPNATYSDSGCNVGGAEHAWDTVFFDGQRSCACHAGRVSCRAPSPVSGLACFRGGHWFSEGASVPRSARCGSCSCRSGRWVCPKTRCTAFHRSIEFSWRTATLDKAAAAKIDDFAKRVKNPKAVLEIRGHADPDEGKELERVAFERAKAVYDRLRKAGVPADRLELVALGASEPIVPAGSQDAKKRNPRVEIRIWSAEELGPTPVGRAQ